MSTKNIDLDILKDLCEADGISGFEKEVSRVMKHHMEELVDEIFYDNLGSIIGVKKGDKNGPKIMISGHMDEVGFMVRSITEEGYIKMLPVGGWWGHVLPTQELIITTSSGRKIKGIVGARAPHGMSVEEKSKVMEVANLFLDLGVESKEEVEKLGVAIGDMVTPNTKFELMNNPNYFIGKAFDDRMGCGIAIEVLRALEGEKHNANIYAVGSVQEEVGIRGARTATNLIRPDVAFALDVTTAKDTPIESDGIKLGCGVLLSSLDSLTIAHKGLLEKMQNICNDLNIEFSTDFMVAGGTDACNIHKSFDGIITMTLSVPTRYMHSHKLIIHRKDYTETIKVLAEFCKILDSETLEEIRFCNR